MIKILQASAGAGKTFNLAKTYIALLMGDQDLHKYRHILAVTFTNKATEEMKSRILKELHVLAVSPSSSKYLDDLLPLCGGSMERLSKKSRTLLSYILHDYGSFAVSTIDGFFQQALKAFAREMGQFTGYQVELDVKSLVVESVDRVLDSISEDTPELLEWLSNCVIGDMHEGRKYSLEKKLISMAETLKSDEHRSAIQEYGIDEEEEYSQLRLAQVKKKLDSVVAGFVKKVRTAAKAFVSGVASCGLDQDTFCGTVFNKIFNTYVNLKDWEPVDRPSKALMERSSDYSSWFRTADRKSNKYAHLENVLLPLLQDFCNLFEDKALRVFNTARMLRGQIRELGVAADLEREFKALMKEKNVLCLDDSNVLLKSIIDGTDAPFIYERLGVRFSNFLLDEFQDTSRIQWDNFRPLLVESIAGGNSNLIVGDVKQSIYRWRGGDWKLMDHEVRDQLSPEMVKTDSLKDNYRSARNIVDFNNRFFKYAAGVLDSMLGDDKDLSVKDIYDAVEQNPKSSIDSEGLVEAIFCPKDASQLDIVLDTIRSAIAEGARGNDLTVLVRDNKQGSLVARHLIDNGISVVSEDSLHLKSSLIVRQAVSLLSVSADSGDSIGCHLASELGADIKNFCHLSLLDLCEEIFRVLSKSRSEDFENQVRYVQSFMDYVKDFSSVYGNSIDAFLRKWEEADVKISSPSDPNSVRVMTIHKSKGLEFDHVILPFTESMTLFKHTSRWVKPEVEDTVLADVAGRVYHVSLSKTSSDNTLFSASFLKERELQFVDNINALYVAFTRPMKALTIIAQSPEDGGVGKSGEAVEYSNFSQILLDYLHAHGKSLGFEVANSDCLRFKIGETGGPSHCKEDVVVRELGYPSFPLNPIGEDDAASFGKSARGRLKCGSDTLDFFSDEALASRSARLNGTVMHAILSEVLKPSDLKSAVRRSVESGSLDEAEAPKCLDMLSKAIASHPEWFPEDGNAVLAETALIDSDGSRYKPDRVIIRDGKVTVIDYKFGERNKSYLKQVERYAGIYRRMGCEIEGAYVWHVPEGIILESNSR